MANLIQLFVSQFGMELTMATRVAVIAPLALGALVQLVLCMVFGRKWMSAVPMLFGFVGLLATIAEQFIAIHNVLLYWAVYFMVIYLVQQICWKVKGMSMRGG